MHCFHKIMHSIRKLARRMCKHKINFRLNNGPRLSLPHIIIFFPYSNQWLDLTITITMEKSALSCSSLDSTTQLAHI